MPGGKRHGRPPRPPQSRHRDNTHSLTTIAIRWRIAAILLAGLVTYANSLSGAIMWDDELTLVNTRYVRALNWSKIGRAHV